MKQLLLALTILTAANTIACSDFNEIDLAGMEDQAKYETLSSEKLSLTREQFAKYPALEGDYDYCADALVKEKIKIKSTGNVYTAVYSMEDYCDGGNSYGNVLTEDESEVIGSIGDSFITCFKQ